MDIVEDFAAKVTNYGYIWEQKNIFCNGGLAHLFTFYQCLSYFESFKLKGWFK